MPDIIVKSSSEKSDPRDPNSYHGPEYFREYQELGARRMKEGKMIFATNAERRDYERAVNSNPNNVMGCPTFFPPLKIRSRGGLVHDCTKHGHRWSNNQDKFCLECDIDKEKTIPEFKRVRMD